jgi:hypothetical protein
VFSRVHAVLQNHAERGVFRRLDVAELGRGGYELRFLWHGPRVVRLRVRSRSGVLSLVDVLPEVAPGSTMDRELRNFLRSRCSPSLVAHRRIDSDKASVRAVNRAGSISLELKVRDGDFHYGARKLVKLLNEVFHGFLSGPYEAYMVRVFGAPEE